SSISRIGMPSRILYRNLVCASVLTRQSLSRISAACERGQTISGRVRSGSKVIGASESACGADVVHGPEVVINADVVENTAQRPDGDPHAVGSTEAAELTAPLQVRLQFEKHPRTTERLHPLVHGRQVLPEVAENRLVSRISDIGGHKVLQTRLIHDARPFQRAVDG